MKPEEQKPTGVTFWVAGIVAARDHMPYVQLANTNGLIGQLTIAEARNIALDLFRAASYAEADAMLVRFFEKMELPMTALGALMMEFRDFRHALDMEKVDKSVSKPERDNGEQADGDGATDVGS